MIGSGLKKANHNRGFTLWEVLAAIVLMSMMALLLYPGLTSTLRFGRKSKTQARLTSIRKAVKAAYEDNAMVVDSDTQDELKLSAKSGYSGTPLAVFKNGLSEAEGTGTGLQSGFKKLVQYTGGSASVLALDGFKHPWRIYVSNRLSKKWRGYTVYYHVIAFVSNNGGPAHASGPVLNSGTTFNKTTGRLTLGGHDIGFSVSGYPIEVKLYKKTLDGLQSLTSDYATYFTSRYMDSTTRDTTVDYFSSACPSDGKNASRYQPSNPVANTCSGSSGGGYAYPGGGSANFNVTINAKCKDSGALTNSSNYGLMSAVGVSPGEIVSAWGYPIGLGNGVDASCPGTSVQTRDPSASSNSMDTPPYTAEFEAWAPGGIPLVATASGRY